MTKKILKTVLENTTVQFSDYEFENLLNSLKTYIVNVSTVFCVFISEFSFGFGTGKLLATQPIGMDVPYSDRDQSP